MEGALALPLLSHPLRVCCPHPHCPEMILRTGPHPRALQGLPSLPRAGRRLAGEPREDAPQRARTPPACPTLTPGHPAPL